MKIVFLIALLLFARTICAEDVKYRWVGTINQKIVDPGDTGMNMCLFSGSVTYNFTYNVSWVETHRIHVKNRDGELTGQFVVLKDDDSHWVGGNSGYQEKRCKGTLYTKTYRGSGEGFTTLKLGWIYYSLSEDDPLSSVLPSGAYMLWGDDAQHYRDKIHYTETNQYGTKESDGRGWAIATYKLSRANFHPMLFMKPNATTASAGQIAFAGPTLIAEELANFVGGTIVDGADNQIRAIEDNRIKGSYQGHAFVRKNITHYLDWDIGRRIEIEAELKGLEKDWLPLGGDEENEITISAEITNPSNYEGKFKFTLYEVTKEPGYAINMGDSKELDLEFATGQNSFLEPVQTTDGWTIESTESLNKIDIIVKANDYGAWGKLKCEVIVDGEEYDCKTSNEKDFTIPLDEDENKIADSWEEEEEVNGYNELWDEDPKPQNQDGNGDGFSLYEEYRGAVDIDNKHQRLSPKLKELFIKDEDGIAAQSNFETASGLKIIYIGDSGWSGAEDNYDIFVSPNPETRQVNYNSKYGKLGKQHAVHIVIDNLGTQSGWIKRYSDGLGGVNAGGGNISPGSSARVLVFPETITEAIWQHVASQNKLTASILAGKSDLWTAEEFSTRCPDYKPFTEADIASFITQEVLSVTVHELGHAVGIEHHVPDQYAGDIACYMRYYSVSDKISICENFGLPPEPAASIFTTNNDCAPGQSCYGQIRPKDR